MEVLKHVKQLKDTIESLKAKNKAIKAQLKENDNLYQDEKKTLLRVISKQNRKIKQYNENKEIIHLRKTVKQMQEKNLLLNKKINKYEMEKV